MCCSWWLWRCWPRLTSLTPTLSSQWLKMIFSEKFSTASLSAAQQKCFEEGGGTKESVLPGCAQAGERVPGQGVGHLPLLSPCDYGRCQLKVVLLLWIPMFFCGTQFFTTNFTLHSASTRPPSDWSPLDCSLPSLTSGRWWPRWPSTTPCISWATRTLPSLPWVLLLLMVRSKYTIYCINTLLSFYWFITGACCRFIDYFPKSSIAAFTEVKPCFEC